MRPFLSELRPYTVGRGEPLPYLAASRARAK